MHIVIVTPLDAEQLPPSGPEIQHAGTNRHPRQTALVSRIRYREVNFSSTSAVNGICMYADRQKHLIARFDTVIRSNRSLLKAVSRTKARLRGIAESIPPMGRAWPD